MNSTLSRHYALTVATLALLGGSVALAAPPIIDPTITTVTGDTQLNDAMEANDLHEEALNHVDEGAMDNLDEAQQGQQEASSAAQDAAEATQEGAHGGSNGANGASNGEGA